MDDACSLRPIPQTMRHIQYTPGCDAQGLTLAESPVPEVGDGEVLIQVAYSGVGGTDIAQRNGKFNPKGDAPAHHLIMGLEVSGIVAKCGTGVTGFTPGSRVCALLYGGGYAEYAVAPAEQVLELPEHLSLQQGAAVPENYWTVWANLFDPQFGNLITNTKDKSMLVHGGAGGIGFTAITLAHHFGARAITTISSESKAQAVTKWGADVVIDYTKEDFVARVKETTGGQGVDAILCFIGGDYMPRNIEALAPYGRLVQLGVRKGKDVTFDLKVLMNKWGIVTGGHLRPRSVADKGRLRDALRENVVPLWEQGALPIPEVQSVLPLGDAAKAHAMMESSQVIGKIVLDASQVQSQL